MLPWMKKKYPADLVGHNTTVHAIDVEACTRMASMIRTCTVPDGVLIAEVAFLRASAVRSAIDTCFTGRRATTMKSAVGRVVLDAFAGEEKSSPPDVLAHYGSLSMADIATEALAAYEAHGDMPMLTCPAFCARVRAPGMTNYEVQSLVEELIIWCQKTFRSIRVI